jgi:membrane protease YdiL (CAAX protease family)
MYLWSGSMWLAILVHFINNAVAVVFYFYYYGGYFGKYLEEIGTPGNGFLYAFIGAIAGFSLLIFLYRKTRLNNLESS